MKRITTLLAFVMIVIAIGIPPSSAHADGIIICDPGPCPEPFPLAPLAIKYHHVTITINDQVAVTHVDQVFYNPSDIQVEGTYLFPLPDGAAVTGFTLWVDGKPVEGRVLNADEARQTYENIVRQIKDPALLEYADRGAVQARIFPIAPHGERRVELEYTQALLAENGLVRYVYPLNTEKFSVLPLEEVSVTVQIHSSTAPIRAVYSPTHEVAISREDDHHADVGYEESNITPNTDFAVFYSLGQSEAFHLLTYRDPNDPVDSDGFFLLLLAPQPEAEAQVIPKDVLLVLDHSGSMEGEKFQQAQEATRYILQHLNPYDRFNLITFSTSVETYADSLRPAEESSAAITWLDRLSAMGSTDINWALLEAAAMSDHERPTYLIFLTDGLPTAGETNSDKILNNLSNAARDNSRLFVFGVGYDVDTFLLDSLAQAHHGASSYVLPGERLDEILSNFYAKIKAPLMTDLKLDFSGVSTYDLFPSPMPDLFMGSQIIVVGRYRDGGVADVTLTGTINGRQEIFRYPEQVFKRQVLTNDPQATIPRLWATRKTGHLLNQIRLYGPDEETIAQIVRLSIRYGIVTPYTSYLVTEEMPLGATEQERIANEQFAQIQATPSMPPSGPTAVQRAADQGKLAGAESASAPSVETTEVVKIVGARTFVLTDGIWIDTAFDPDTMQTTKITFLSENYFSLADARPELADAFALGPRVIAISDGIAYEIVAEDENTQPVNIPPTYTPESNGIHSLPATSWPCGAGVLPLLIPLVGVIALYRKRK